ncbi:MAG: aminotransferase class V-fold PLP-dependent enzyme [Betaproteobacteria bacterium]|nr:MAG: aminotransferase class V-fold PLP-dependent enzyme [Betaproteobacteria bacterium]
MVNTTNISFHGVESGALLILIDKEGICASSGSACLADSDEPSHVIKAMKPEGNQSGSMIRFSAGLETTCAEVGNVCDYARRLAGTLRLALV